MSTVLVLDDRAEDRELLATLLRYAGHEVVEASDGIQALELARASHPDVIVTDILMPVMGGYDFVSRLREDPALAGTEVIFCTASYLEEDVRSIAAEVGVERFISKPCPPEVALAAVEEALRAAELRASPPPDDPATERDRLREVNARQAELIAELEELSARRQRLLGLVLVAHEDERERLATGIHDDPLQAVTAVGLQLAQLSGQLDDPAAKTAVQRLGQSVKQAGARLRLLLFDLHPPELHEQPLADSVRSYLERVRDEEGLEFALEERIEVEPPADARRLLQRLTRELLMNVRKHAGASQVELVLLCDGERYLVRVSDDGIGFDQARALYPRPGHLGLAAMGERVQLMGGQLRITSAAGRGTTIEVELPAPAAEPTAVPDHAAAPRA